MKNFSTTVFIHFAISLLCVPPNWCSTASCNSMIRWLQDGKNSSITYLCTCNAVQLSKRVCTTVENKLMLVVPTGTKTCVNSRRHSRGKRKEVFAGDGNKQAKHCWIITIYHNCSEFARLWLLNKNISCSHRLWDTCWINGRVRSIWVSTVSSPSFLDLVPLSNFPW
jgi:hypothetical protein